MILHRTGRLLLAVWLGALCHLLIAADDAVSRTADGGQHSVRDGVSVLSLVGDPTALGRQAGELLAPQTQVMLTALSLHPAMTGMLRAGDADQRIAAIPPEYRDEITAWAKAATCDVGTLLRANLAVDVLCTAVVRLPEAGNERPLMIARNMDFAPAQLLGPKTVLIARRPTGRRASVSIGWPGYAGVVSGMNDAGVSACLLLNHAATPNSSGDSLGFRLRAILDQAGSLQEALALFSATPTGSSNYVLLADATSSAVVWWGGDAVQRMEPKDGWVLCTNAHIDPASRRPTDIRGQRAHELTRERSDPDIDWMKGMLSATYMPGINAQAMVLVPATRAIHLAIFDGKAAALSAWHAFDGAALMAGSALDQVNVTTDKAISEPFAHYAGAH
jgi:hypothetical protein